MGGGEAEEVGGWVQCLLADKGGRWCDWGGGVGWAGRGRLDLGIRKG